MRSPFGLIVAFVSLAVQVSAQQPSAPLPTSTLPLRLLGVALEPSAPDRSAGMIQCGTAQELRVARFYKVGDRACDLVEVREVLERALVIRNLQANRLELLTFAARRSSPIESAAPAATPVESREAQAPRVETAGPSVVPIEISRDLLRRYMANLPELLTAASATPHYGAGGVVEGYEVSQIQAGGAVERLGLQNGDVLLEFNGRKLDGLAAVTGLLGQLESLSDAKVTVLRGGAKTTLLYRVK